MVLVAPGPGGYEDDAGLAGGAGVAVGHVGRALLVPGEDEADLLGVEQRVEDGHGRAARMAEDVLDAEAVECFDDFVGSSRHVNFSLRWIV